MKKIRLNLFLPLFLPFVALYSQVTTIENLKTSISIYQNGLGLINQKFEALLPENITTLLYNNIPNTIDPRSVLLKFDGTIFEQTILPPKDNYQSFLEKLIGKEISFLSKTNIETKGIVISVIGNTVFLKREQNTIVIPDAAEYIIAGKDITFVPQKNTELQFLLKPKKGGKNTFELNYLAENFSWECNYSLFLDDDEKNISIIGWAIVSNKTNTFFKDANLQLIAGEVLRTFYDRRDLYTTKMASSPDLLRESDIKPETLFEYYTYHIPAKVELPPNQPKQFKIIEATKVPVTKTYKFEFTEGSAQQKIKGNPSVLIQFNNSERNNLGIPLPNGTVNVYQNQKGTTTLLGQTSVTSIPKDELALLEVGKAFNVVVEVTPTKFKRLSEKTFQAGYTATIRNHKNEEIEVQVVYNNNSPFELNESTIEPEKITSSSLIFKIIVPKNASKTFSFSVNFSY